MLYLIGLGLNSESISKEGLEALSKCKRIYLETYTVNFPYSEGELKQELNKKIIPVDREFVESMKLIDESKKMNVALLIYGSPLTATTHISLIQEAKMSDIKYKIIYNASVLDAVAETGLQLYKFGKVASMPKWDIKKNFIPDSFMEIVKENMSINAHSLILIDIGLEFSDALDQLEKASKNHNIKLKKIILCRELGTKSKRIYYGSPADLENKRIVSPYCIIIPSKLHFLEKEILETFS